MSNHWILQLCFATTCLVGCNNDPQRQPSIQPGNGNHIEARRTNLEAIDVFAKQTVDKTALCTAIEDDDREKYRQLLAEGDDPNLCDSDGTSAMHLAARQKDLFWLREALKHNGNPNQLNTGNQFCPGETPIFYAIHRCRDKNVLELMAAGADINHIDDKYCSPLYDCMEQQMYLLMIKMIEAGAAPSPPKPAHSIFANGWFDEQFEKALDVDWNLGPPSPGSTKADYFALKKLLIEEVERSPVSLVLPFGFSGPIKET